MKFGFDNSGRTRWQTLKQNPLVGRPAKKARDWILRSMEIGLTRLGDAGVTTCFWINWTRRESLRKELLCCQNISDYYQLAKTTFGLTQIESEITAFIQAAASEQAKTVLEIGVEHGGTNFLLSQALPAVELLVGIDLFVKGKARLRWFAKPGQQFHYIDGSSHQSRTVERFRKVIGTRKLDILFIDGDHSYEGVKADFLSYRSFVREGGLIAFHDICPDYLSRFGRETGRWVGGVPIFWKRVKALYKAKEFVQNPNQDGLGIGVIRYDSSVRIADQLGESVL